MRQPIRLNTIASPSAAHVPPPEPIRVRRPRPRQGGSWRDTRVTDSGAVRAILATVAVVLIATVLYLVSLSSHPGIENIQPAPHAAAVPGPIRVDALVRAGHPIEHVELTIDGQPVLPAVTPHGDRSWEVSYETVFPRGQHQAAVTVIDDTGAVQRHTWSFASAGPRVAPTIVFSGPPAGLSYAAGTLRLHAEIASDTPLKTTLLTINGDPVSVQPVPSSTSSGDQLAYSVSLQHDFKPGAYVVQLKVTDGLKQKAQDEWALTVVPDNSQATAWYYPETDSYLYGAFKTFWQEHGGQKIFGNPVNDQFTAANGVVSQYFTNARFELQKDGSVGLGLLGREAFHQTVPRVDNPNKPDITYFDATGHTLRGAFKTFWEQNGGLPIFGYPISEVVDEDGTKVQYFERARFEYHPDNPDPYKILLGRLGADTLARLGW